MDPDKASLECMPCTPINHFISIQSHPISIFFFFLKTLVGLFVVYLLKMLGVEIAGAAPCIWYMIIFYFVQKYRKETIKEKKSLMLELMSKAVQEISTIGHSI